MSLLRTNMRHHTGPVLVQAETGAFEVHQGGAAVLVGAVAGCVVGSEPLCAGEEFVDADREGTAGDAGVGAEQARDGFGERRVGLVAGQAGAEFGGHRLGQVAGGEVGSGGGGVRRQPCLDQLLPGSRVGEGGDVVVVGRGAHGAAELVQQGAGRRR